MSSFEVWDDGDKAEDEEGRRRRRKIVGCIYLAKGKCYGSMALELIVRDV